MYVTITVSPLRLSTSELPDGNMNDAGLSVTGPLDAPLWYVANTNPSGTPTPSSRAFAPLTSDAIGQTVRTDGLNGSS